MRLMRILVAALMCVTALSSSGADVGAQAPSVKADPPRFADPRRRERLAAAFPEIDRIFRAYLDEARVPGAAWAVIVDGEVAHAGQHGYRELETKTPVDQDTVFRIASMTKSFTAMAILKLRDEGRLSLDDLAERHVPELADLSYPTTDSPRLTIRHLLSHAGGFPEDNPWGDQQLAITDDEMAALMRQGIPFSNAPGMTYEYSNFGFAILGRIVSRVSRGPDGSVQLANLAYAFGLRTTQTCDLPAVVGHAGGLPGYGSLMLWLPDYGVGIIAAGNLTYTGWGPRFDAAFAALGRTGALQPRLPQPSPALLDLRDRVSGLVAQWDETVADDIAAMNLYRDRSKDRRRADFEAIRAKHGACTADDTFDVENALRGAWTMRCERGVVRAAITLAPTMPPKVQFVSLQSFDRVEDIPAPLTCR